MRHRLQIRTAAIVLAFAWSLAACGDDSGRDPTQLNGNSGSASGTSHKPWSEAELSKVVLSDGDLDGYSWPEEFA